MANDTLALTADWDLDLDDQGSLRTFGDATPSSSAVGADQTGPGMRLAQDVATRLRAWRGEVWFDVNQGIDYVRYLGEAPAVVQLSADYQSEALLVPECNTALADLVLGANRTLTGTLFLTDLTGYAAEVAL